VPDADKRKLEFEYDYQSRRIAKKVYLWSGSGYSPTPSVSLKFVYDGWNLIAILTSEFSLQTSFSWGLDLSGSNQGAGGVGGLLAATLSGQGTHFIAYDGNGNVMSLVSASGGTVTAQYEYSPFGEVLSATGTAAGANPMRFSTKYQDSESGLYYYGFRYYNPFTGKLLSRDPMEEEGSISLYTAMGNDPIDFIDPFGFEFFNVGKVGTDKVNWLPGGKGGTVVEDVGLTEEGSKMTIPDYYGDYISPCKARCWVKEGTGLITVWRSYIGVHIGWQETTFTPKTIRPFLWKVVAQYQAYYFTSSAAARVDSHEERHINKTEEIYNETIRKSENVINNRRQKKNPLEVLGTVADCILILEKEIDWNVNLTKFNDEDANWNRKGGLLDQFEVASYRFGVKNNLTFKQGLQWYISGNYIY
jgi:RHS repeat-associated protein